MEETPNSTMEVSPADDTLLHHWAGNELGTLHLLPEAQW
jgi:hypothetical protein